MKKIFLPLFLVLVLIGIFFIKINPIKSEEINCNPDSLTINDLIYGNKSINIKNFNSCLNLLGFRFGEITDQYDNNTKNAVRRFFVDVLNYDSLDEQLDSLSNKFIDTNNFRLFKNMAKKKIQFEKASELPYQIKYFQLPDNYNSLNDFVISETFKKILVSYRNNFNKNNIFQIDIVSERNYQLRNNYDFISEIGFTGENPYFKSLLKSKDYLIVYNVSSSSYLAYGPYDLVQDFKIYDNKDIAIFYSKNIFNYINLGNLSQGVQRFGPFVNSYDLKLSPFESKIGFISLDQSSLERVGQSIGQYLGLISKNNPEVEFIPGFALINNFDFALVNASNTITTGYIFSFKPLWQNIVNFDQRLINDFMSDWLYVSGDSFCKNYNDIVNIFNSAYSGHITLQSILSSLRSNNCTISTSNLPINQDYLDKVISSGFIQGNNFQELAQSIEGPLSVCGPYNRIYKIYLSPDRKKIIITYTKNYLNGVFKGIAGLNLTKYITFTPSNQECNINNILYRSNCRLDINSYIAGCLQNLFYVVSAQSSAAIDFYSTIDFDDDLGVIFSKDGNRFAFFYRKLDKYKLDIFDFPVISEAKKIMPIARFDKSISALDKFIFSPNGKNYAFISEEEDLTTGETVKKVYVNNILNVEKVKDFGDFIFSKDSNVLVFWYNLENDNNNYLKVIDLNLNRERIIGPFLPAMKITDVILSDDGSNLAIMFSKDDGENYLYYNDQFYKTYLNPKTIFLRENNTYKLIVIHFKNEIDNNGKKVGRIYLSSPSENINFNQFKSLINSVRTF
ncbi:MAG: hypothetical protein KatS3mg095_0568 [Candidatus Parcubacteria bacterium]|nr:MAG: hypothetical protein KatS3mg095_0568 [Candidatus Parcubacteria bacterium]